MNSRSWRDMKNLGCLIPRFWGAQIVTHSGEIGFLASALVLATFAMKDMVNLRIVAICSNVAFIAYALVLHLVPILEHHPI